MADHTSLPPDLPVPIDDGAAAHLPGRRMPEVTLPTSDGGTVDLGACPPVARSSTSTP